MVDAAVSEARFSVTAAEDVDAILTLILEMRNQLPDFFVLGVYGSDVGPIAVQRGLVVVSVLLSGPPHELSP
jgi:hypothetical protein